MHDPRYRTQSRPTALNARRRRWLIRGRSRLKRKLSAVLAIVLVLFAGSLIFIPRGEVSDLISPPAAVPDLVGQLSNSLVEVAAAKLEQGYPDEALANLTIALKADAGAKGALNLIERILQQTVWHIPVLTQREDRNRTLV